jgi:hypothetical protein
MLWCFGFWDRDGLISDAVCHACWQACITAFIDSMQIPGFSQGKQLILGVVQMAKYEDGELGGFIVFGVRRYRAMPRELFQSHVGLVRLTLSLFFTVVAITHLSRADVLPSDQVPVSRLQKWVWTYAKWNGGRISMASPIVNMMPFE